MKKKIYLAMLAVCFALTASACGDDGAVITDGTKTEGAADGKKAETGTTRLVSVENVEKYITIGEYKGLTLDNTVDAITDDDVQAQIDEDLKDKAEPVSDAAKEGDLVTVNYTGTKDGQTFDGGTANNYDFVIGDGQMFEEFENGVIGMKKGDTKEIKIDFPSDWGVTTSQAYFPKDNTAEFDNDLTITDWLTQYSEIKDATYVRGFLGRMLFPGEDGIKRVRVLSGGEKVRCLLSKMMISGANILILDEPTNHLDMESITALNNGLIKFPGVILFTSHDHQFVQTTANRIMEILPNGTMIDKITTYDEYLASDEMAKKRHVFEINEEDASDN